VASSVSKQVGASIDAIRFYERNRLLAAPTRSEGGFRLYPSIDVAALQFIHSSQTLGFSLNEIRDFLSLRTNDPTGTYGFAYDNMGRLVGTTTQYTFVTGRYTNAYTYDANSNRASMTDPQGGVTSYVYDALNRLSMLPDKVLRWMSPCAVRFLRSCVAWSSLP
jgi:YD repeat-containing protein